MMEKQESMREVERRDLEALRKAIKVGLDGGLDILADREWRK